MRRLVLGGADPSAADGQGFTVLHYAAIDGSPELVRTLLEHGPAHLVLCEALDGETSLWFACANGLLGDAKMLITPHQGWSEACEGTPFECKEKWKLLPLCRVPTRPS